MGIWSVKYSLRLLVSSYCEADCGILTFLQDIKVSLGLVVYKVKLLSTFAQKEGDMRDL